MLLPFCLLFCLGFTQSFPPDFIWGAATASYQIEGAWNEDGRGMTIWDTFSHAGKCYNNETGDVADEHYHRVHEDIELMKQLGISHYRMSFSWTRIFPTGEGKVNPKGVQHYNKEIDLLLAAGITPFVTLFHWDLPQPFQDAYGGWLHEDVTEKFAAYAEFCFKTFGNRVKHWLTLNEPHTVAISGYYSGKHAPGRCSNRRECEEGNSVVEPYIVGHNLLLAHAKASHIYKTRYQSKQHGVIGLALDSGFGVPMTDSKEDSEAANRWIEFFAGWFADPIFKDGDYPASMRANVGNRLPKFTPHQKALLKGSSDFFALNHYTSSYCTAKDPSTEPGYNADQKLQSTPFKNGKPIGPPADSSWLFVYPPGMKGILLWLHHRYGANTTFYITENGVDVPGENAMPRERALKDQFRVDYYTQYLHQMHEAMNLGQRLFCVVIDGQLRYVQFQDFVNRDTFWKWQNRAHSIFVIVHKVIVLNCEEWNDGYHFRFGLHYVDYKTQKRYQKDSAKYFKNFISRHK